MSSASSTEIGCDRPSTRKTISLTRQKLAHLAPARSSARASGSTNREPLAQARRQGAVADEELAAVDDAADVLEQADVLRRGPAQLQSCSSIRIRRGPFRRASPLLPVRLRLLPEPEPLADLRHETGHGATLRPCGRLPNRNAQSAAAAKRGRAGDRLPSQLAPAAGNLAHAVRRSLRMRNLATGRSRSGPSVGRSLAGPRLLETDTARATRPWPARPPAHRMRLSLSSGGRVAASWRSVRRPALAWTASELCRRARLISPPSCGAPETMSPGARPRAGTRIAPCR
jgi:hypothetical protein